MEEREDMLTATSTPAIKPTRHRPYVNHGKNRSSFSHKRHYRPHQRKQRSNNKKFSRSRQPTLSNSTSLVVDQEQASVETLALEGTLRDRGCCPHDDGQGENERERRKALDTLEQILYQWVRSLETLRFVPEKDGKGGEKQPRPSVALITFGSYRLQVHSPNSDLDVLALSPPICRREDFFTSLVKLLADHPDAKDVHPIASAFTPVIKFLLRGIHIDMLFARVEDASKLIEYQQKQVVRSLNDAPSLPFRAQGDTIDPTLAASKTDSTLADKSCVFVDGDDAARRIEYLIDDTDLAGMDEAGIRSVNGARVSQMLLEMVPDLQNYRTTLKAVKEWALINGVYSNVLGFLGGVNFAILVAWICIRHPNERPTTLLRIFFGTFSGWSWPAAVSLVPIQKQAPPGAPAMPIWDPTVNPRDQFHVMPIITPAYPCMNSAYNVGYPQLRRIQVEMYRAATVLEGGDENWRNLFQKTDFFTRHSNYLQITIRADNPDDFLKWLRLCESRMRLLITALETTEVMAWPFAKFFRIVFNRAGYVVATPSQQNEDPEPVKPWKKKKKKPERVQAEADEPSDSTQESCFFIALRFAPGVEIFNIKYLTTDFLHKVNSWEERKDGMDLEISHVLQQDLPPYVFEGESDDIESVLEQDLSKSTSYERPPRAPTPEFNTTAAAKKADICVTGLKSSRPNTPVDQGGKARD